MKYDRANSSDNFGKTRKEIIILDIRCKDLQGDLDLSDFNNLKELYCFDNKLTSLKVSNLNNLWKVDCQRNQLTDLDTHGSSSINYLDLSNNCLTNFQDLLINLNSTKL